MWSRCFLKNDTLFATHETKGYLLITHYWSLYLNPLEKVLELPIGKTRNYSWLIDIKSETYSNTKQISLGFRKVPKITDNPKH